MTFTNDPVIKLYQTAETVWQTAQGRQWVACARASCPRYQMERIGPRRYRCRKCKTVYELQT